MNKKLKSLAIFFPFYHDEGTVEKQISDAYFYGSKLANKLEVIAIHGGDSKDKTLAKIKKEKRKHTDLIIIDKADNFEGYAVIKYGLAASSKEWVFYTDGDAQYRLSDLEKLVKKQIETLADVVNGYKINRHDSILRVFFGEIYRKLTKFAFNLPINDVDCDFRLIRKKYLNKIKLGATDASILPELIKKLEFAGAKFAEVPVSHYERTWGKSNYNVFKLFWEKIIGDFKLWLKFKTGLLYTKS